MYLTVRKGKTKDGPRMGKCEGVLLWKIRQPCIFTYYAAHSVCVGRRGEVLVGAVGGDFPPSGKTCAGSALGWGHLGLGSVVTSSFHKTCSAINASSFPLFASGLPFRCPANALQMPLLLWLRVCGLWQPHLWLLQRTFSHYLL